MVERIEGSSDRLLVEQFLEQGDIAGGREPLIFSIPMSEQELPEPSEPCGCQGTLRISSFPYVCHGNEHIAVAAQAPGYECNDCGGRFVTSRTKIQLLSRGAERLIEVEDFESGAFLLERAAQISQSLTQATSTKN